MATAQSLYTQKPEALSAAAWCMPPLKLTAWTTFPLSRSMAPW